jgi:mono/diheme cytochrome c family protein
MRKITLACVVVLVGAGSAGAGPRSEPDVDEQLVSKGRALAEGKCARCHALGLEGESPHKEAPPFRVVVGRYPVESLAEALAEGIASGHPDMPEFVFEPPEIEAFLTYLEALRQERAGK